MSGCTKTDKPLISIVMAVYEPNMDWLQTQLCSLNSQTYPNLELRVLDDCSPTVSFESLIELVAQCITRFSYVVERSDQNEGSNRTFEKLTAMASGAYIAYCDQDDSWLPEKLAHYQDYIEAQQALLVCSDMYIMNGAGQRTADSITAVRRHHVFRAGSGLAPGLLVSNFVTGCAMMLRTETAKAAMPFCPDMVHDHYLALYAAAVGSIAFLNQPLISYRIHENNQTLAMAGVRDKQSYLEVRIRAMVRRLTWLQAAFYNHKNLAQEIDSALVWATAREANFLGHRGTKKTMWRLRRYSPLTTLFELVLAQCPDRLFMSVVELKRKNKV